MLKLLFILPVRFYQLAISPLIGSRCRFYPSCSHYMIQAIEQKGIIKGVYLGLIRLSKCHPWHEGGMDPVPGCECSKEKSTEASSGSSKNDTQDEKKEETN